MHEEQSSGAGLTLEEARANAFLTSLFERKPTITWAIAVMSVMVFGLQMLWGGGNPGIPAARMGAMLPSFVMSGQVWRILAPMLLHGSVIHLVMNMVALFSFGTFLERLLGWRRYLLLYILSGLGGSLASFFRAQEAMSVGASGGIWGLMVGGAVLLSVPRGTLPEIVSRTQKSRAWFPVLINAAYSFQPGIDWLAHLGGGLVGAAMVLSGFMTLGLPKAGAEPLTKAPQDGLLIRVLAPLFAAALIGSVVTAVLVGQPWVLNLQTN